MPKHFTSKEDAFLKITKGVKIDREQAIILKIDIDNYYQNAFDN